MKFSFANPGPALAAAAASSNGRTVQDSGRPVSQSYPVAQSHPVPATETSVTVLPGAALVDALSNPDAEFEVCGWFLRAGVDQIDLVQRVFERLQDGDMAHGQYRNIVSVARLLVQANQVVGVPAVLDLANRQNLDVGGAEHLALLISDPINANTDIDRVEQAIDQIIEYSVRRRVRRLLQDRLNDLPTRPVAEVIAAMSDDAAALQNDNTVARREPRHISAVMNDVVTDAMAEGDTLTAPIATGFDELDTKLNGGVRDGELVLLAGRPAMGKTALAMGISRNMSLDSRHQRHVLVFSGEMKDVALGSRMLSAESAVPAQVLRAGSLAEHDNYIQAISEVLPRFGQLGETAEETRGRSRLWIDDQPGISMSEIRSRTRRFARVYGRPIVVVDYLQIVDQGSRLAGHSGGDSTSHAIGLVSQGLKHLARELNTPVIALSQLNRALEQRANKVPILSDLRESGSLEQDADIILFVYRDVVYNPDSADPDAAQVIIGKQREGDVGPVNLRFNGPLVRFENWLIAA